MTVVGTGERAPLRFNTHTDGSTFAFGNTEEALRAKVFGLTARGEQAQGPHDRRTGTGWVAERQGDYSDARAKGHGVALMGCESTGAIYHAFSALLRILGKAAVAPGTQDSTVYGTSRASPSRYYAHHASPLSRRRHPGRRGRYPKRRRHHELQAQRRHARPVLVR